ncbi:MAG TPA: PEGA domain-containing protein [Planctomycetota bacterium]|nr:PEGA domain-containing protein [Planctomycetota bacterium]
MIFRGRAARAPRRARSARGALGFAAAAAALLAACRGPAIDYDQLPDLVRLETDPPGADVQLSGYAIRFVTPCDIKRETLRGREITVVKEGYAPFQGTLADIPAGQRGTFRLTLRKLAP